MVTNQEIAIEVETLLRQSHPSSLTSFNDVVQRLEAKLGLDLSEKVGFIRDRINLLLRSHPIATTSGSAVQSPPPTQVAVSLPVESQFAAHHHSPQLHPAQSGQVPSHFALQSPHLSYDLNFQQPYPVPVPQIPPSHHQQQQQQHSPRQPPLQATQGANAPVSVDRAPNESAAARPKRKGGPGGLNKVCGVSPELQVIVGEPALPRTEIVKQLWAYIRKNNLQDPSNKRRIICDEALRVLFETDSTDMFIMNKLLAKHIRRLDPSEEARLAKRMKVEIESTSESTEPVSSTIVLSEPLAKFFETDETEMVDSEVTQRIWQYIKLNNLEDPLNPMAIQCDEKLRDLLGCESISALRINEMLRRHMYKQS